MTPGQSSSLGQAEGTVAAAHELARIIWAMIIYQKPYDEKLAVPTSRASAVRRLKHLQNQAKALNMQLVPA